MTDTPFSGDRPFPSEFVATAGADIVQGQLCGLLTGLVYPIDYNANASCCGVADHDASAGESVTCTNGVARLANSQINPVTTDELGGAVRAESATVVCSAFSSNDYPLVGIVHSVTAQYVWVSVALSVGGIVHQLGSTGHAAIARVDQESGSNATGAVGNPAAPFVTVQAALDAIAASGYADAAVDIGIGDYDEIVTWTPDPSFRSLSLRGAGFVGTNIKALLANPTDGGEYRLSLHDLGLGMYGNTNTQSSLQVTGGVGLCRVDLYNCQVEQQMAGIGWGAIYMGNDVPNTSVSCYNCQLVCTNANDCVRTDSGGIQFYNSTIDSDGAGAIRMDGGRVRLWNTTAVSTTAGVTIQHNGAGELQLLGGSGVVSVPPRAEDIVGGVGTGEMTVAFGVFIGGNNTINIPNATLSSGILAGSPVVIAAARNRYIVQEQVGYAPTTSADWSGDPETGQGGIDRLAAAVAGLLGGPIP